MISQFYWRAALKLIKSVSLSKGCLTIEFDPDIGQLSKDICTLCDNLGIAVMSSPEGDREHFSITSLQKTCDGNKIKIELPVNTDFPGFIGIRVYYVYLFRLTISRRFYMSNNRTVSMVYRPSIDIISRNEYSINKKGGEFS